MKKHNLSALYPKFKSSVNYAKLNSGQKAFFDYVFTDCNVLLTGSAGVGKSYCLTALFHFLEEQGVFIAKAAMTGVAAINIGGSTVHSWAGMGLADEDIPNLLVRVLRNKKAVSRIKHSSILFIDEVSMASADFMEKLDAVLKNIRYSNQPFGGIKVVFSGDFLQLGPVFRGNQAKGFAFDSIAWKAANIQVCELKKLVRQDENSAFAKLLQKIRKGSATPKDIALLQSRMNVPLKAPVEPIKIFCRNVDIDRFNMERFKTITKPERTFVCIDTGDCKYAEVFDRNCLAPAVLRLKEGAQVMLLANIDTEAGLVNGLIGTVKEFLSSGQVMVKFLDGQSAAIELNKWEIKQQEVDIRGNSSYRIVATRKQLPLRLAYAASVHKCQGQTLDYAHIDLSGSFDFGQCYTALSRVKNIEGLSLTPFDFSKIRSNPDCVKFYET